MRSTPTDPSETENQAQPVKRPWVTPDVSVMEAGSAEAGPNPFRPEGAFAMGS